MVQLRARRNSCDFPNTRALAEWKPRAEDGSPKDLKLATLWGPMSDSGPEKPPEEEPEPAVGSSASGSGGHEVTTSEAEAEPECGEQTGSETQEDDGFSAMSPITRRAVVSSRLEAGTLSAESVLKGCTTVMMRHIPHKYTQQCLLTEINAAGFQDQFDFFYLPTDVRTRANRGFAFINFVTPEIAEVFFHVFHGQQLRHFNAENALAIVVADHQGFEQNALKFAALSQHRRKRTPQNRPLFLRPTYTPGQVRAASLVPEAPEAMAVVPRTCGFCGRQRRVNSPLCDSCGTPLSA